MMNFNENDSPNKPLKKNDFQTFDVEDAPQQHHNPRPNPFSAYGEIPTSYSNASPQQYNQNRNTPTPMVNQPMPTGQYNSGSGSYLAVRPEVIGIKVPAILHEYCFQKLFPRNLPRQSTEMFCPNCNHSVSTVVKTEIGGGLLACTLGAVCLNPCCFWLPLCLDDCYDISHNCPQCRARIRDEKFLLNR